MAITANVARGIRNNNPLNIEHNPANKWLGLDERPSDGRFCRFVSADYGVRAACLLLMTYQDRHNLRTIRDIVEKWAPANENNVSAYVAAVSTRTGFTPNQQIDLHNRANMEKLVAAMARHETGRELEQAVINKGLALAGYAAVPTAASIAATPTMLAATAVSVPTAVVTIAGIVDGITNNGDTIAAIVGTI